MFPIVDLYLLLLGLLGLYACQANSGHWEFQAQLYGTNPMVILNRTRWDPSQPTVYLYFDACPIETKNPGQNSYFTGCGGLSWEREYQTNNKYVCPEWRQPPGGQGRLSHCRDILDWFCLYWDCPMDYGGYLNTPLTQLPSNPNCQQGTCNPIRYTIQDPTNQEWVNSRRMSVRVDGRGRDPGVIIRIQKVWAPSPPVIIPTPRPPLFPLAPEPKGNLTDPPTPNLHTS